MKGATIMILIWLCLLIMMIIMFLWTCLRKILEEKDDNEEGVR